MDGILIDSEPFWQDAMIKVFKEMGLPMTREIAAETMGIRIDEVVAFRYEKTPWKGKSLEEVTQSILDEVIRLVKSRGVIKSGVIDSLSFFKQQGLRIGLASSSAMRLIQTTVGHLGLESWFEVLCSAETEKYGKPHPAIYLKAANSLNIEPIHCLAIEDSLNGLVSARAARMKTIAIPDLHARKDPRFVLADLKLEGLEDFNETHWNHLIHM